MEEQLIERLNQVCKQRFDGNASAFARATGALQQNVSVYLNKGRKPSFEFIVGVLERVHISAEWLFRGAGEMFYGGLQAQVAQVYQPAVQIGNSNLIGNSNNVNTDNAELERLRAENEALRAQVESLQSDKEKLFTLLLKNA